MTVKWVKDGCGYQATHRGIALLVAPTYRGFGWVARVSGIPSPKAYNGEGDAKRAAIRVANHIADK